MGSLRTQSGRCREAHPDTVVAGHERPAPPGLTCTLDGKRCPVSAFIGAARTTGALARRARASPFEISGQMPRIGQLSILESH
jgi:hypothetical protein